MANTGERGGRWLASLTLLLLLSLVPAAAAQLPPAPSVPSGPGSGPDYLLLNMGVVNNQAYVFVQPGQQARLQLEVEDASADRAQDARNPFPHMIQISATIVDPPSPRGWTVTVANNTMFTAPGTMNYATLMVSALFAAEANYVRIAVNGSLTGTDGRVVYDDVEVTAQLLPFYAGRAEVIYESGPANAGQQEIVRYGVRIENQATYPDWFSIHLNSTPGFIASAPERVYVPPLESRVVNLTIYTPRTGFYEWGTLGIVAIEIRSQSDPGFRFQTAALVNLKGFYVPGYWVPLLLFAMVAGGALTGKYVNKRREAIAREGRPRRPQPTPRQAVLLKELRRRDPQAYKAKMATFAAIWKARRDAFREARKSRHQEERALARQQRQEAKAEKRRRAGERKAQRKADALAAKDRKAALAELARKQAVLAKVRAKEEKVRAKAEKGRRKELDKLRKAKEKQLEKARKAAAKAQLAAEKAAAREARAAAKAAAKAGKAEAEPGRKGPGENP